MRVTLSPREIVAMVDEQVRSQALVYLSKSEARRVAAKYPVLTRMFGAQSRFAFLLRSIARKIQRIRQRSS
jgi:hypothetical protein